MYLNMKTLKYPNLSKTYQQFIHTLPQFIRSFYKQYILQFNYAKNCSILILIIYLRPADIIQRQVYKMQQQRSNSKKKRKIHVKRIQNSPYVISESQALGSGSFAVIKKAYNIDNPAQQLAVKILSIADQNASVTIKSELQMLKQLPYHPNLVNNVKIQITSQKNFYIFMEFCNQGNLEKVLHSLSKNKFEDISQEKIWFFLKQVTEGYQALYQKNIIHRDLKPQNILIHNGNYKIGDFGLSKCLQNAEIISNMSSKGTPLYMAPQLHLSKQGSAKVDIFSLGIILYRLSFRGKYPFFDENRTYHSINQYFKQLKIRKLVFPKNNRSPALLEIIEKMLQKNPTDRIGWKQIFSNQKIRTALRNQRRKQIISMDQFRNSLLIIGNTSVAQVHKIQEHENQSQSSQTNLKNKQQNSQQKFEQTYLMIEQAFNKKQRTLLQKKIYFNKLIYTLIDIANRRILRTLQKQKEFLHPYIEKQLQEIVYTGFRFALHVIGSLENISGDWERINKGQLLNFEDIFDNDRQIILAKLNNQRESENKEKQAESVYEIGLYEQQIYRVLTQYYEYPKQTKQCLKIVISFLLQIYDLALKYHASQINYGNNQQNDDLSLLEKLTNDESGQHTFQDYLLQEIEQCKNQTIIRKMKKMGLLII